MKAAAAFASLMAPHIERYLTLKQALGREDDEYVDHCGIRGKPTLPKAVSQQHGRWSEYLLTWHSSAVNDLPIADGQVEKAIEIVNGLEKRAAIHMG